MKRVRWSNAGKKENCTKISQTQCHIYTFAFCFTICLSSFSSLLSPLFLVFIHIYIYIDYIMFSLAFYIFCTLFCFVASFGIPYKSREFPQEMGILFRGFSVLFLFDYQYSLHFIRFRSVCSRFFFFFVENKKLPKDGELAFSIKLMKNTHILLVNSTMAVKHFPTSHLLSRFVTI